MKFSVGAEKSLFVSHCDQLGHFFGQFDNRPTAELKALEAELFAFYGGPADYPLLYDDVRDHIGDFAVVKWTGDGQLYRVEVVEELAGSEVNIILKENNSSQLFFMVSFFLPLL